MNLISAVVFFSIFITTFQRGFFSFAGFTLLVALIVMLFILYFKNTAIIIQKDIYTAIFVATYSLFLFFASGIFQKEYIASILLIVLPIFSFPIVLSYMWDEKISIKSKWNRYKNLLGLALVLRILIIIASPSPIIDVYTILKEAPQTVLAHKNPYDTVFSQVYSGIQTNYYAYWPGSILLEMPFVLIFHDPRVLFVIADIASALMLYAIGNKSKEAELISLTFLFRPNSLFIIEQSWLTPLAMCLILFSYVLIQKKQSIYTGIMLGILLSVQVQFALIIPFLLLSAKDKIRIMLICLATVSAIVFPFYIWNPQKFIDKTLLVYFKPLSSIPTIPVHLSLNLNTAYYSITGNDMTFLFVGAGIFGIALVLWYRLYLISRIKISMHYRHSTETLAAVIAFYSFYFLFRQAFINYYYLCGGLLLLWLAAYTPTSKHQ